MKRKKPYLLAGLVLLLFLLCTACGNTEGQIAPQDDPNEGLGGGLSEDTVNDFSGFEGIWLGEADNDYDSMEFDAEGNWTLYLSGEVVDDGYLRYEPEWEAMLLWNILQAVIHFHEMIAFFDNIAARGKMAVLVDAGIPAIRLIIEIRFYLIRHIQHFQIVHINTPQRFLIGYAGVKAVTVQILCQIDDVPHRRTVIAAVEDGLQCFQLR